MFSKIKRLLNQFRGVCFLCGKDGDTVEVTFTAECQYTLMKIISCENSCPIWTIINCVDHKTLEYTTMFAREDLNQYLSALRRSYRDYRKDVSELMSEIDEYRRLDKKSREKYLGYIKYLRKQFANGREDDGAKKVLDAERIRCGKALYSLDTQIRTILEFDDPARVREILEKITCENER